mmetsp:Transcript_125780/g.251000  ORF Transcript_125780/g.251000 Transcript_125780/m.251000 type:complete len:252 (-) Transcript_125780:447-1202(-)
MSRSPRQGPRRGDEDVHHRKRQLQDVGLLPSSAVPGFPQNDVRHIHQLPAVQKCPSTVQARLVLRSRCCEAMHSLPLRTCVCAGVLQKFPQALPHDCGGSGNCRIHGAKPAARPAGQQLPRLLHVASSQPLHEGHPAHSLARQPPVAAWPPHQAKLLISPPLISVEGVQPLFLHLRPSVLHQRNDVFQRAHQPAVCQHSVVAHAGEDRLGGELREPQLLPAPSALLAWYSWLPPSLPRLSAAAASLPQAAR